MVDSTLAAGTAAAARPRGARPHASRRAALPAGTLAELVERLGTSAAGLTTDEAERREHTSSAMPRARPLAQVFEALRGFANPLVAVLAVAGIASAFLGDVVEASLIGAIVVMSGAIDTWQTARSAHAVKRLQAQITPTATVLRDGAWRELPRTSLVVGDVVRLGAGDLVPADARLIEATDLHVQQAALTGESLPAEKAVSGHALVADGPDVCDLVYLGTSVVSGTATAVVFAVGADTSFGDVVAALAARPDETEFERGTRRFGFLILETVIFLVLFVLVVNIALGRDAMESLLFSVALAVGLTPEFLPMISSVTLAQGAIRMAREKVITKHLPAIQNLGSIDILCSDKTGTLTSGTMSLDASLGAFGADEPRVLELARLNSRFQTGIASPLDTAILAGAPIGPDGHVKTDEIPFDFERRRTSIVVRHGDAYLLVAKGAPESMLAACTSYVADNAVRPLDRDARARCEAVYRDASQRGFRVLAVASRAVPNASGFRASDERDLVLAGFLTFADHVLTGAAESIASLRADGVAVKILTGDNELVTRCICDQVGLTDVRIVLGSELDHLSDIALAALTEEASVFARVSPSQKHRIVKVLKAAGHVVGFLGDGINDAPSLHAADVGISVAGAVDVAREAADIVLLERRLDVLHGGIIAGRRASGNVLKYLLMGTSSNFGNMFSMAGAALLLPFLPMLPIQILLNNFLYDFAQITIPTDNVEAAYLRKPQRWDIQTIRRFMWLAGPISSAYDFLTFFVLLYGFGFSATKFHTGWFVESLATQTLVLFVIRTAARPWRDRPSVPLAVTTLGVAALGVALPFTSVAHLLGFEPLPLLYFAFLVAAVGSYLVVVELVKARVFGRAKRVAL
ncbi:MAG TPA: magnesium-translocating P-type ATPase [Kofleriaceae bacterium]|nr:magnesium-translocating P-type ATPase [Kofleriaceae bacterium]